MKKILVPCDFSDTAKEAFKFAVNIAKKNDSEIHVLYVIDIALINNATADVSHIAAFNGVFMQRLEQQFKEKFAAMKSEYAANTGEIAFRVDVGSLTQTIALYVQDKAIDLVVMGTHGASGLKEFFIGSNTEKVVRYLSVPVVAVPIGSKFDAIRDIIFPVVPSHHHASFIHELKVIQNFFQATLHLLWINTPHIFKSDAEALEDLEDFANQHHFHNYKLVTRNDYSEQEGILRFARDIQAGLIFMPTHSRKGLMHWITGSVTENVINHVQCPVWTCSINNN